MPNLGAPELIIILVVVIVIFGVGRLPEVGGALGRGIKEFRKSASGDDDDDKPATTMTSSTPSEPASPAAGRSERNT